MEQARPSSQSEESAHCTGTNAGNQDQKGPILLIIGALAAEGQPLRSQGSKQLCAFRQRSWAELGCGTPGTPVHPPVHAADPQAAF